MIITRSHANATHTLWTARDKNEQTIGTLLVNDFTYDIDWVGVLPSHRRKGIATALLTRAREDGYTVNHSPVRSPEGQAWALSTGDPLPYWQMI